LYLCVRGGSIRRASCVGREMWKLNPDSRMRLRGDLCLRLRRVKKRASWWSKRVAPVGRPQNFVTSTHSQKRALEAISPLGGEN